MSEDLKKPGGANPWGEMEPQVQAVANQEEIEPNSANESAAEAEGAEMQDTVPAEDTEATASVAAEDMDAVDASSPAAHETAEEVIECFLPNGLHFRGTREEYHQEVMDWLDNVS